MFVVYRYPVFIEVILNDVSFFFCERGVQGARSPLPTTLYFFLFFFPFHFFEANENCCFAFSAKNYIGFLFLLWHLHSFVFNQ
jgi:hypothetical protein